MRHLTGHKGNVRAVLFLPDGRLVSAGEDRSVRRWDVATGTSELLVRSNGPVYALARSPDARTLAYAGRHPRGGEQETAVHLWDLAASRPAGERHLPSLHSPRSVWSLSFSHDGAVLAAVGRWLGGGNITAGAGGHWWTRVTSGPLANEKAFALAFAPDRPRLAVAGDGRIGFHPTPGGEADVKYPLPVARPSAVTFIPESALAAVAAAGSVYVMSSEEVKPPRRIKTSCREVLCVTAFPNGRAIASGGVPGVVEVFRVETGERIVSYDFEVGKVFGLAVAPDGLTFAVAGERGLAVCDADEW